jgi:hypothetical protein
MLIQYVRDRKTLFGVKRRSMDTKKGERENDKEAAKPLFTKISYFNYNILLF